MSRAKPQPRSSAPLEGCPRCRELAREVEVLRAQLRQALERIQALEAEVRRGRRQATPFSRE